MIRTNDQKGSIIIYAISMLSVLIGISIIITAILVPKLRTSSDAINSVSSIYAADSGMEWCLYVNRGKPNPPAKPVLPAGVSLIIYEDQGATSVSNCAVGTFRGVSRSLSIE